MLNQPLVLFDGICNLCNGAINFIIKHDRKKIFRFSTIQSDAGKKAIKLFGIPEENDSVILIFNNQIFLESEAILKILRLLPFPWNIATVFSIIPKGLRNKLYKWIAKNRYLWFGTRTDCRIPSPEEKLFFPDIDKLQF